MPWNVPDSTTDVEKQLEAPMPWIGMYVAAASLICTLAMAADAFNGFHRKKYWFPSKYFSLNATSLTLLAVAMKLPVDLTTWMYTPTDRLARVSSLVFMSTAMANFLTSLGSMGDKDILMNVTALSILVITVSANVGIQVMEIHSLLGGRLVCAEEILAVCAMLLLLFMFSASALMIPSTKQYLETKYKEMHKSALLEEHVETGQITTDKLRVLIKKYWIMAETSSPQFVIARSVTSTASGVMSFLISLVFLEAQIRMAMEFKIFDQSNSSYRWSTKWILLIQTIGVIVATIAPASRWLIAISFRSSNESSSKSIKSVFIVESYWTQKMVEWEQGSLSFRIRHLKSRKAVHGLKGVIIKLCIFAQFLIVLASKLVLLVSVYIMGPPISCFNFIKKLKKHKQMSHSGFLREAPESTDNPDVDIKHYVMLLEGEIELPTETLGGICKDVDYIIQKGKMLKPKNLLNFLHKSRNFNGVAEFDSHQIQSLHSQDLPYCWSLPVVTITSIALALPNVEKHQSNSLLNCVTEGLPFVELVDKKFDKKGSLANIRTAADVVWVGVELYNKWQDNDLHKTSLKGKNATEILQELGIKAEKTVLEFKSNARDCLMRNPLNWPAKVIAANSMHRITTTILLTHGVETDKTDDELFDKLSIMIADIMAACLTNLTRVITMKCHSNSIEKREKSVREAAILLGETEEILGLLQQRELPVLLMDTDKAAYIEEWRAFIKKVNKINQESMSMPNAEIDAPKPEEEHETIKVEG